MVQLRVFSGNETGNIRAIKRFPCVIGRALSADLRIEEPGIWDRHAELDLLPGHGCSLTVLPDALATVNGYVVERVILKIGDLIQLGGTKLQFSLTPTRQRGLRFREAVTWLALATLFGIQIWIITRLLP